MNYFPLVLAIWAILVPAFALAETPEGASEPAFQEAVEIWLADDDAASLPMLADLARNGNTAAQILLGQLEFEEKSLSPWVATIGHEERRAIFTAPGGRSGRSWLADAAERSDIARLLYAAQDFRAMRSVVPKLTARGESRAVDRIVGLLWGAGEWDALLNLQSQRAVPAEFLWSVWNAAMQIQEKFPSDPAIATMWDVAATVRETDPDLAGRLETSIDRLAGLQLRTPGIVRSIREMALPDLLAFADYTTARLRESDVGMQFAAVCSTLCPSQTPACIAAANPVSVLGGFPVKSSLGSPVAILIPAERYAHSRRAIGEVLRRHVWFSQFAREPDGYISKLADKSQCLADHVQDAMAR